MGGSVFRSFVLYLVRGIIVRALMLANVCLSYGPYSEVLDVRIHRVESH